MELEYKKYDSESITSGEVPATGKQFVTALFIENDSEDGGYSGQSKAHSKTFFEDTHALQFKRGMKAMDTDGKLKVIGTYVHTECPAYYVLDKEGKKQGRDNTKAISDKNPARIGHKLTFFLLKDEDFESARRQALKRIEKNNAFVDISDEPLDTEEEKANAITSKKGNK